MKRAKFLVFVSLFLLSPSAVHASNSNIDNYKVPTLVIIDTAIDTSMSIFKDRIVQEVCIVEFDVCPNGKSLMEGPGAATLPIEMLSRKDLEHGTQMASLAIKVNPNIKIIFIRIAGIDSKTKLLKPRSHKTVNMALDWVIANQKNFNIQALTMLQAAYNVNFPKIPFYMTAPGTDYCPKFPETNEKINTLMAIGVPAFFPAGNNSDKSRISWPACIPSSVAIGAVFDYGDVASYSNNDLKLIDFYARGNNVVMGPKSKLSGTNGTSGAAVITAASWISVKSANPNLNFSQIYDSFLVNASPAKMIENGKLITVNRSIDLLKTISNLPK